jgi:acyl-CoA synthetase (AMP-forming)/AMP-acid ligase II
MSFASPFPPVPIPDVPVFDYLFGHLDDRPGDAERIAILDAPSGARLTYGALRDQVLYAAGALAARGVAPGEVVALHAPNCPEYAVAFHGTLRAGAAVTTIAVLATAEDIARQLTASGAVALVTDPSVSANALAGAEAAGLPAGRVILLREPGAADGSRPGDSPTGDSSADDSWPRGSRPPVLGALIADHVPAPEVRLDPATHVAALPYSSGTTGRPKGVRLSHRNLVANLAQSESVLGVRRDDIVIAVLPFFHIYGLTVVLNLSLLLRATIVTMPRFEFAAFLDAIARHRVSFAYIAPPIALALAKHPAVDDYDLSGLRVVFSGAAPLDGELGRALARRLDVTVVQGYGMTELSPASHLNPPDSPGENCENVGFAVPNTENKLLDPATGAQIPQPATGVSEPGELCVKGPNVMLGYLDDQAATDAMIDGEGFLHTGDIATVDAEGRVTIVDRIKELIKYKGYQVAPAELEALLLTDPRVADAAVIGVTGEGGEELPKAFVVRGSGPDAAALTEDQVMEFVAGKVAPYKKVRLVEFIDAVPKSASGKILRRELRERERARPQR